MNKRLLLAMLTVGLLVAMLPSAAAAGKTVDYGWGDGPNQGNADKVIPLRNSGVDCCDPVPGDKYEGDFGRYEKIWSDYPIYGVTVKSGKDADFWVKSYGQDNGRFWIKIKGTKGISNFVIWTCPCLCVTNGIG